MKRHRTVSARQEALNERAVFSAIAVLRTAEECRAFFRDLCTPAEIQAMADRWAAVDCRILTATIAPLARHAPKAKTASECGQVPLRGSKWWSFLFVIVGPSDRE